jgi:hypothetical protein
MFVFFIVRTKKVIILDYLGFCLKDFGHWPCLTAHGRQLLARFNKTKKKPHSRRHAVFGESAADHQAAADATA